jgi:hypothetical protein
MPGGIETSWLSGKESLHRFPGIAAHVGIRSGGPEVWRVLAKAHDTRNLGEYEGDLNVDERLVTDLVVAAESVASELQKLPQP